MIQITLTFPNLDAARKALLEIPENALLGVTSGAPAVSDTAQTKKEAAPAKKEAAKPVEPQPTVEEPAAPEKKEEGSVHSVDYPTLQKAVFALAGKSRDAAAAVAQSFGVKTFKELDSSKWGDALDAVQAKIAELG